MKTLLIIVVSMLSIPSFKIQDAEFVCLPCGRDCDNKIYNRSGKCSSCEMKLIDKSTIHFTTLSIDDFCKRIHENANAIILDVRSPGEFNGTSEEVVTYGHFKNAININVADIEGKAKELEKYKSKEILVYCSHAHRSAVASYFLSTHGFGNVKNMSGGVSMIRPASQCLKNNFVGHAH